MSHTPVTPKDAAAMVLLRNPADPQVYWVKRSLALKFMGGWHAFPGGQRDAGDYNVPVLSCADPEAASIRACVVREVFEETGALIARGVERLSPEQLAALREELAAGQISFAALLEREGLTLDASLLTELPRYVTPPTMPRRYNTFFFAAWLPAGQETGMTSGELHSGEWLRPREALNKWQSGETLIATPILDVIKALNENIEGFAERLHLIPQHERDAHQRVELRSGFLLCSLRTPTLPPATHTNCFIVGGDEFVVIDPGSPYAEEQQKLDDLLDVLLAEGRSFREVIITHLHPDHIGGVNHLAERYGVPVAAHRLTAEAIADTIRVDRLISDNEVIELKGRELYPGESWRLRALWSPGHARGHLSFYEENSGSLITGDCVVGMGTVVIAPPEGNMTEYLTSLHRYLELPRLTALFPAHGPVLADARAKIEEYIHHRCEREARIIAALSADAPRPIPEIVKAVYTDVPEALHKLAELSVLAHLEKLEAEGKAKRGNEGFTLLMTT
ncbi:MAG TPA: MBL fold metallo-hydrolase [Blastocatellia bacterium]|nr:MBL fold metallo-hydrolase [Blastocatellia bacterium]